jgi:hypothetical protein
MSQTSIKLGVLMLSFTMLSALMLNITMLSVMAPTKFIKKVNKEKLSIACREKLNSFQLGSYSLRRKQLFERKLACFSIYWLLQMQ